jgi:hypothetical protein
MTFFARKISSLFGASAIVLTIATTSLAQTVSEQQMRAANLARMQAELLNGGLSQYSTADCMHKGGGSNCLESSSASGFRFRFLGGPAGWSARRDEPTIETVVFVSPDGKLSRVEYNGPVRSGLIP